MSLSGALIVTAAMAPADLEWLDAQRREHFPPERNVLTAHLTMFHALPPSCEREVGGLLSQLARQHRAPPAMLSEVMSLGRGVAYRVRSDELEALRAIVADHFHGMLSAQDSQGWRPHVSIQNKVPAADAKALFERKRQAFEPRRLAICGLALNRYLGGPWEEIGRWSFSGTAPVR